MRAVGLRELKNRLSEYVRMVRSGDDILVTDRGAVVAELRAPGAPAAIPAHPGLAELARQGKLTLGGANDPDLYPAFPPLTTPGLAQRLLDAERGDD